MKCARGIKFPDDVFLTKKVMNRCLVRLTRCLVRLTELFLSRTKVCTMVTEDSSWTSSQTDKSSQGVYKTIGVKGMDNFDMDNSNSKAGEKATITFHV